MPLHSHVTLSGLVIAGLNTKCYSSFFNLSKAIWLGNNSMFTLFEYLHNIAVGLNVYHLLISNTG